MAHRSFDSEFPFPVAKPRQLGQISEPMNNQWPISLASLPASARWMISIFLALIGFGYFAALSNLYQRHQLADEKPGLTLDDLRTNFAGMDVPLEAAAPGTAPDADMSKMLHEVLPGGDMRKELIKGEMPAVRSLTTWLQRGAEKETFETEGLAKPGDPSAMAVIRSRCLRCHNVENGEKADTPYGPDMFEVDYGMVYVYARPGSAESTGTTSEGATNQQAGEGSPASTRRIAPQSWAHLQLVAHIHMLAIPVFTLIVGGLFLLARFPAALRGPVTIIPMASLVFDFASWFLARNLPWAVYAIAAAGVAYGTFLGIQILAVFWSLWFVRDKGR
jgi:hypothetical protein